MRGAMILSRFQILACILCLLAEFAASQEVKLNWTYIEQLGTGSSWSAISSDSTGQHLVASVKYNYNTLVISQDYGLNWFTSPFYATNNYYGFSDISTSSNGAIVTCVSRYNGLWVSSDYGTSFINPIDKTGTNSHGSGTYFSGIDMNGDGTLQYATVYGDYLYKSVDSGQTWDVMNVTFSDNTTLPLMDWTSIATSEDGSHIYAVSYYTWQQGTPSVVYSYDYGVTWGYSAFSVGVYNFWDVVCSQSGQYVATFNSNYPVGYNTILVSTDYGVTFTTGLSVKSNGATFVYFNDLTMDGTGQNLVVATQGAGVILSQNYGVNGSWSNNTVPMNIMYGYEEIYSAITVDQTGRYFVTLPSYGPSYTTHNYTWEEPSDDKKDMSKPIGFGLMGFGLGLIACMVIGIYVKEFAMTGRSITTLFDKPKPQHVIRRAANQSKEPARLSEPLIADGRPVDDII